MKNTYKIHFTGTLIISLIILSSLTVIAAEPADSLKTDDYYTISLSNNLEITGQIISQDYNYINIKNKDGIYKILKQDISSFSLCDECKSDLPENYMINKGLKNPKFSLNVNAGIDLFGSELSYNIGAGIAFYPNNYFSPRLSFNYRKISSDYFSTNYYCFNLDLLMGKVNPKNSFIYYGIVKIENDIVKESSVYNYNYGEYVDHSAYYLGFIGVGGGLGMRLSKETSFFFECSTPIFGFTGSGGGFLLGWNIVSLKAGCTYSF